MKLTIGKKTKKWLKWIGITVATLIVLSILAWADCDYLKDKPKWNTFDKVRAKVYYKTGALCGTLVPPCGKTLSYIHYMAAELNIYLNKQLPPLGKPHPIMRYFRRLLLSSDSFCKELRSHEAKAINNFKSTGSIRFEREITQRVYFWGSFFDDLRIYLCTDIYDGQPKTSFLVWGMGITEDPNGCEFFGKQMPVLKPVLCCFNRLAQTGVGKDYWILLSESDETSAFSYEAVTETRQQRINKWLEKTRTLHKSGKGFSAAELCGRKVL
jgi:hypothetical protein